MAANISNKTKEYKKNNQSSFANKRIAVEEECAVCGAQSAEYSLDDRQMCVECYQAEKHFWDKDQTPTT